MDTFNITFKINDEPPSIALEAVNQSLEYQVWCTVQFPNGVETNYGSSLNPFTLGQSQSYVFTPTLSIMGGYLHGKYKFTFYFQDGIEDSIQSYEKDIWFTGFTPNPLSVHADVQSGVPYVGAVDQSNVEYLGFSNSSEVNDWDVTLEPLVFFSLINEPSKTIDLVYNGSYYHTKYTVSLSKTLKLLSLDYSEFYLLVEQNTIIEI